MKAALDALLLSTYPFSADKERGSGCEGGGRRISVYKEVGGKSC